VYCTCIRVIVVEFNFFSLQLNTGRVKPIADYAESKRAKIDHVRKSKKAEAESLRDKEALIYITIEAKIKYSFSLPAYNFA
jgi:hypothetical protein